MHIIIVEDATATLEFEKMGDPVEHPEQNPATFDEFVEIYQQIRHRATPKKLKEDLIEHLWAIKGDNYYTCDS